MEEKLCHLIQLRVAVSVVVVRRDDADCVTDVLPPTHRG